MASKEVSALQDMHKRLEIVFSDNGHVIHLDLNGLLCDVNPDSLQETMFHSVLVGTSSMTLKEEFNGFLESNQDSKNLSKYCVICLYRLEKKLA
jgi:hypothetical protein